MSARNPPGPRQPRDPGLAHERTALAWQRMALGFMSVGALTIGVAARHQALWMLLPAALLFVAGAVIWAYGRMRAASAGPADRHARALAVLAAASVGLAVMAVALVLARPA
ncbi:MAG: hypothetical protein QOJ21_2003 [Solirubrobacteraceae bacterium]|nr:hypothetical protein [Solirubrobacteraceae bacterium]